MYGKDKTIFLKKVISFKYANNFINKCKFKSVLTYSYPAVHTKYVISIMIYSCL